MIFSSSDSSPHTASTNRVDAREQFDYWRSIVVENYVDVEVESPASITPDLGFRGNMRRVNFGGYAIDEVVAEPVRVNRSLASVRRSPGDYYQVSLLLDGRAMVMQNGRAGGMNFPGDFCLIDTEKPYIFDFLGTLNRHAFFKIPKDLIDDQYPDLDRLTGCTVNADSGMGRLAAQMLLSLSGVNESRSDQVAFGATASSLALTITALREKLGNANAREARPGEALFAEARAYIGRNLGDSVAVSPQNIAAALNISERYLYKIFTQQGTSPLRWTRMVRLNRASVILRDSSDPRTIKDIALSLGFRSSAHFSRAFSEEFGCSPREMQSRSRSVRSLR